jgi:hypothetical protein
VMLIDMWVSVGISVCAIPLGPNPRVGDGP